MRATGCLKRETLCTVQVLEKWAVRAFFRRGKREPQARLLISSLEFYNRFSAVNVVHMLQDV
jgi:hypothetical protein